MNVFKWSHLFSCWALWGAELKRTVGAGGGEKYISLLCFVAFFPRHYKAVMGDHREKQIAPLLASNRPHFNVPPLRDSLLCYSRVWAPPCLLPVFMNLYRESRRYSDLTRDKCFIQMLLSHIVEEVMNSCAAAAAAGPVHRVKPEHAAGTAPQQQN